MQKKYDKWIISDEIHADLTRVGVTHTPLLKLAPDYSDRIIVCTAPSKTFNLAGLIHSHVIIFDGKLMEKYDCYIKGIGSPEVNLMGITGMGAAFRGGRSGFRM